MNHATLEKLANNPHYKMSAKQRQELEEKKRESMTPFGQPQTHNTNIPKHPTGIKRNGE